jgi:S-DNA-T family DNA segregation ATPase FtsK/SpoIIIE
MRAKARRHADPRTDDPKRKTAIVAVMGFSVALIMVLALWGADAGILGETMVTGIQAAFGKGAWVVPLLLILFSASLTWGKPHFKPTPFLIGELSLFIALSGFLARPLNGDYFDPQAITATGGYVGACVAWLFSTLLKDTMYVGLGALAMVGILLCAKAPLSSLWTGISGWLNRRRKPPSRRVKITPSAQTPTKAVVEMPELPEQSAEPEPSQKPAEKETPKKAPKLPPSLSRVKPTPSPAKATPREEQGYELPPISLLQPPAPKPKRSEAEIRQNIEILENTLQEFGIEANVVEIAHGPTLTRYEIQLGPGIRVSKIKSLADNLAMSLAASHVRVEAPIPGKAAIGVEVPNATRAVVMFREVAESEQFLHHPSKLAICLGQDVSGQNTYADLAKMPHLLIGGATNSGKSIGLISIIMSLLLRNTPKDLQLALLDPKRVELSLFEGLPHLICPVVTDLKQMPLVLRQIAGEMDRRYDLLAETKCRNLEAYNEKVSYAERLPYLVVVIDELADLMFTSAKEVETSIARIAQLARATGIHLVIATQRPSVDVITGTIKANISSRIAYAVSSQVDSRTILDGTGAESLIGQGDMLFLPIDAPKPIRVQGCYVTEKDIAAVCDHWKSQAKPHYAFDPASLAIEREETRMRWEEETDPFWEQAVRFAVERGEVSTSMLQRHFAIGFQRASRLLDMMEERGIVAPRDGPRPREVLISPAEIDLYLRK